MKKMMLVLAMMLACGQSAGAQSIQNQTKDMNRKVLVAYFSATGTTAAAAERLADAASATLYEIQPAQPYTAADLDWHDKQSRSSVEMNDADARPPVKGKVADMAQYDVVFIGFPVWWNLAPRVVNTFIESHDLKGKTVVPFATSGGSGIAGSVSALKKAYPDLRWKEGKLLNHTDVKALRAWVEELLKSMN